MDFVDKYIEVKITNLTIDRYIKLGYSCNIGDSLIIKIYDALNNNECKINIKCDMCDKIVEKSGGWLNKTEDNKKGVFICDNCKKEIMRNRKCSICGDTHRTTFYAPYGDMLCSKHKTQFRKGKILERTLFDKNEIIMHDTYAEFYTYDREYNINGIFKVDLDMVEFIKTHKIHMHSDGYATYKKTGEKKNRRLHRYIVGLEENSDGVVDHINGDKTDNRKENLRITTKKVNNINTKRLYAHNTSGITGVSYCKNSNKYEVYIHKDNKKIGLGKYTDFQEAVKIREIAELEYFGEYSPQYEKLKEKYVSYNIEIGKYFDKEDSRYA